VHSELLILLNEVSRMSILTHLERSMFSGIIYNNASPIAYGKKYLIVFTTADSAVQ